MSADDDPIVGQLDDALERARSLETRAQQGEVIAPGVLATEMRSVIDSMLAARRDEIIFRARVNSELESKLNKEPWEPVLKWGFRAFGGLVILYLGYLVQKGVGG